MMVADRGPGNRFVGALDGAAKQFSDHLTKDFLLRVRYDDANKRNIFQIFNIDGKTLLQLEKTFTDFGIIALVGVLRIVENISIIWRVL